MSRGEAYRVYNAFRGVKNLNRTRPQDSFETLLDKKGHVLAFEYFTGEDGVYQARESNEGSLAAKQLDLKIELGRTQMHLEDVLRLRKGSVVPLDKLAGDPVDVYVNGRLIARGEVLVLNDNFCVRINEIVAGVKEEGL